MFTQLWFIYALKDPRDDKIRYVGRTQNPKRRLAWHLYSPTNPELVMWLTELQKLDLRPDMEILERLGDSLAEAEYQEVYWIRKHAGKDLLNHYYNVKNLKRTRHKRKALKIEIPTPLHDRMLAMAHEMGLSVTTLITIKLNGYFPQPLPDEMDEHPNDDGTGFYS